MRRLPRPQGRRQAGGQAAQSSPPAADSRLPRGPDGNRPVPRCGAGPRGAARRAIQYHALSAESRRQQGSRSMKIRTAVFPVAGRGTRFLPATKASPKEMLPIVDKPLIQYAAEEALAAGAEKLVFITGSAKRAIEDHFDTDHELEQELEAQGKQRPARRRARHRAVLRQLHLHPPAGAARPGPRGAVLASRRSATNRSSSTSPTTSSTPTEPCLAQMARAFDELQREHPRRPDRRGRPDRQVRHRRGRAGRASGCRW